MGHYNWDYTDADSRIKKLYELGKKLNWNGSIDLDWSKAIKKGEPPMKAELLARMEGPLAALPEEERLEYMWHDQAWGLSQFLHGEQGALLVASQLVSCAPTYQAKLYAASQTFDEARHVEVFAPLKLLPFDWFEIWFHFSPYFDIVYQFHYNQQ